MKRLLGALALTLAIAGCGGDGGDEPVTVKFHGDYDFRMDASDGKEHVFTIDYVSTVDADGHVTTDIEGKKSEFDLSDDDRERLEEALEKIDAEHLEEEFPVGEKGSESSVTIIHDGETAVAGDGVFDDTGEQSESGQAVFAVLILLEQAP